MAIKFKEIKGYLARNVRLSICFEDGFYHDYLMVSDIPEHKYDDFYVYGIGMADAEFSMDVFAKPQELEGEIVSTKDDALYPAIEIVLHKEPRDIERNVDNDLEFRDLKPYLQIGRNFTVLNRKDWKGEEYEYKKEIPEKYNDMYVYGIDMADNLSEDSIHIKYDTIHKKRMLLVLSDTPRFDNH